MSAAAVIGALTVLSACADEEEPLATGGELIRLEPATTVPAATVAPTTEPVTSPSTGPDAGEPVDPVDGCINWYRIKIEAEDPAVLAVWEDELDEDLVQLVAECERLADEEPERVEDMIAEADAIEADRRPPTPPTTG